MQPPKGIKRQALFQFPFNYHKEDNLAAGGTEFILI